MNQTMKKIQSICIVALLAAFALTSCNYTDLDPTDMVGPDKAFGNVQNVHKAVVGIYGKASLRSKLAVTEYIADDCVQGGDSGWRRNRPCRLGLHRHVGRRQRLVGALLRYHQSGQPRA